MWCISLWNTKNATINITNTKIKGFGYSVNLSGDKVGTVSDSTGCKLLIDSCDVSGWNLLNIWSTGATITVKNTTVKGINNLTSATNSFAIIVINKDLYNQFDDMTADAINLTIDNCKFSTYQNATGLDGINTENFIRLDLVGTSKININNSTFTDTTGKNTGVFYLTGKSDSALFEEYFKNNITYTNITATTINADGTITNLPHYTLPEPPQPQA